MQNNHLPPNTTILNVCVAPLVKLRMLGTHDLLFDIGVRVVLDVDAEASMLCCVLETEDEQILFTIAGREPAK